MKTTNVLSFPDLVSEEEDAAIEAAIADPATIATAERAREILGYLDEDIENIRTQIDGTKLEREMLGELPPHRVDWARRAGHALVWKIKRRAAVQRRLEELAPIPAPVPTPAKAAPVIVKALQPVASDKVERAKLRLAQEEAIRQRKAEEHAAKKANIAASAVRHQTEAGMFLAAAKRVFSADENQRVWDCAREMFPDHTWEP
jgi:hypothetical protein